MPVRACLTQGWETAADSTKQGEERYVASVDGLEGIPPGPPQRKKLVPSHPFAMVCYSLYMSSWKPMRRMRLAQTNSQAFLFCITV